MPQERITVDPNRMRGLPSIRDTRVTVSAVLGQLAVGASIEPNTQLQPPKCTSWQWRLQQREFLAEAARLSRFAQSSTAIGRVCLHR